MAGNGGALAVKVWGDFACFTRPDLGVERVSYPALTPSAAAGILEAILWKPEMRWRVVQIDVLQPIRWMSILRNELTGRQTEHAVQQWATSDPTGRFLVEDHRAQRNTVLLRDVGYVIHAHIDTLDGGNHAKYRDQFRRRVDTGQCFARPYLGCREFAAHFAAPEPTETPIDVSEDLGLMLHSIDRTDGETHPTFFTAKLAKGRLRVPRRGTQVP